MIVYKKTKAEVHRMERLLGH